MTKRRNGGSLDSSASAGTLLRACRRTTCRRYGLPCTVGVGVLGCVIQAYPTRLSVVGGISPVPLSVVGNFGYGNICTVRYITDL